MIVTQPPAEMMSDAQFAKLAKIVHADTGIVLTEAKRGLLVARLTRRLRALSLGDFSAYCDHLAGEAGAAERRELLSAITTNVTSFFREEHHFTALARLVEEELAPRARAGKRVRLWSSACSSGEEPYSIAMTILEVFPEAPRHDLLLLATDIDPHMVATAEAGRYEREGIKGLSPERRRRFCTEEGSACLIRPEPRALLRFGELNLHGDWPFRGLFDVIFCRNVVIYFDAAHRQRLWQRLAERLPIGGHLFIGHSERVDGPAAEEFDLVGATLYRKRSL